MGRPYRMCFACSMRNFQRRIRDYNYPMNVVRHQDKRVQFNIGGMCSQFVPTFHDYSSHFVRMHLAIGNLPKETFPTVRNNGHKIGARLCVVIITQANRSRLWLDESLGMLFICRGGARTALFSQRLPARAQPRFPGSSICCAPTPDLLPFSGARPR